MSEMEAYRFCEKCEKTTAHMYSGSGTKGSCMECGNELHPEERADMKRVIYYNG